MLTGRWDLANARTGQYNVPIPMMTPRQMRRARGLMIDELSMRTGIDSSALSRFERGIRTPSEENVTLIAGALGVSVKRLRLAFERLRKEVM